MEVQNDGELLRRCAAGTDPYLWQQFLERFGRRLTEGVRRGLRRGGNGFRQGDAEDLVQEVLCKLLADGARNLRRCRGGATGAIGAYLGRIAETVAIDYLRAGAAAKRGRSKVVNLSPRARRDLSETAIDPSPTPEEALLRSERRKLFVAGCREVVGSRSPRRDLAVLHLAFVQGLSSREIAQRIGSGLTPSSVDSLVHRARKRLAAKGYRVPRRRSRSGSG